jgi:hypothetical protein
MSGSYPKARAETVLQFSDAWFTGLPIPVSAPLLRGLGKKPFCRVWTGIQSG